MKKILLVITKSNWGGAQKYVFDVATQLKERGYAVSVALGGDGELKGKLAQAHIPVHTIVSLKNDMHLASSIATCKELYTLFVRERPDVVHLNSSKIGLFGALTARIAHIPRIVFTAHSWPFNEERSGLQKLFLRSLMQVSVALSHVTICVSTHTKTSLLAPSFIAKKCVVIHNGIAPINFLPRGAFFQERNLSQPTITTLLSIGELHPSKGFDLALSHLKGLTGIAWEWHIIGEGKERTHLEHLIASYNLSDRVFLHGHLYAAPYVASFDIIFIPSRTEGLSYVAIESLQSTLPIIASKVGGIPEVLGNDPGTMFIDIRHKTADKQLREILSKPVQTITTGREELREEFSLSHMVDKIIEVYKK